MSTKFMKMGNRYLPTSDQNLIVSDSLPTGTYTVGFDQNTGAFFLEAVEGFALGKIYGDTAKICERVLHTFQSRDVSTGLLLSGEKGCGKTMLAKMISIEARKLDVPTIVINSALRGEVFNKFIQSINQPCVVIFDEYEKVYKEEEEQNALLTLLDGVYPTKKLFILTTNDRWAVSKHMRNRPGRLFYNIEYKGLEASFIREYCADNLKDKAQIEGLVQYAGIFEHFNFDMLKAVVEEMNRYGETAQEAVKYMNMKPETFAANFTVKVTVNNKPVYAVHDADALWVNPLEEFDLTYVLEKPTAPAPDELDYLSAEPVPLNSVMKVKRTDWVRLEVSPSWLVSIQNGQYVYVKDNLKIVLTKATLKDIDYAKLALVA